MKHLLKNTGCFPWVFSGCGTLHYLCSHPFPCRKNTGSFSEFCTTLFREEMKSNTMNLHFTLKDPKAAGIDSYEITLGSLSGDSPHNQARQLKKLSEELKNILTALSKEKTA